MDTQERLLWEQWRTTGHAEARGALIAKYSSWARLVARSVYRRIYGLGDIWADCAQNALVGLMEAVDRYDPERGAAFETFAKHRVRGAVFNGLRALRDDTPHNGNAHAATLALRERVSSLQGDTGNDPVEDFVASIIGLGLGFLLESQSIPACSGLSDAYSAVEREQTEALVRSALQSLPSRERDLLISHYYHHVPFVQIAEDMALTKGRVSQLHKQALGRLRQMLRAEWLQDL